MEITNQTADLMAAAAKAVSLPQGAKAQKAEAGGKDFDSMIRQKYQESGKSQDAGTAQKQETGKTEDAAPKGEEPAVESGEDQTNEARQLLAAMLYQNPAAAAVEDTPVQTEETAQAVTGAVVVEAAVTPETQPQALPADAQPQEGTQQLQPETAAVQIQPQEQQTAEPVRTQEAAQAPEELQTRQEVQTPQETGPRQDAQLQEAPETEVRAVRQDAQPQESGEKDAQNGETPMEAPLFQNVEAAPVKVADAQPEQVELEAPEGPENLANTLKNALDKGLSVCVIQLKPDNLGVVQVTFSRSRDGALQVLMEAASPKTAALLQKNAGEIQNILSEAMHAEARVEVRQSDKLFPDQWDGHQQQQQQQNRGQRRGQEKEDLDDFMHRLRLGLTGLDEES